MTDEEYENVKKFYQTMKFENLGEQNIQFSRYHNIM